MRMNRADMLSFLGADPENHRRRVETSQPKAGGPFTICVIECEYDKETGHDVDLPADDSDNPAPKVLHEYTGTADMDYDEALEALVDQMKSEKSKTASVREHRNG